jgi:hypothetical protein
MLDPRGEVMESESKALGQALAKAVTGIEHAQALAEGLAGQRVQLALNDHNEVVMLGENGEVVEPSPEQARFYRLAAMAAMEGQTVCMAVGKTANGRRFGIGRSAYLGGSRFSFATQQKRSVDSRRKLRVAIDRLLQRLEAVSYDHAMEKGCGGEIRPIAMVLTSPTLDPEWVADLSEAKEERRLFMAWELFRKRQLLLRYVFGGMRGYEITRQLLQDGLLLFHPHFHCLLYALRMDQSMLAQEWWDCLVSATRKVYGFDLRDRYSGEALQRAITACVHVQAITNRPRKRKDRDPGDHPAALTLQDAILECVKYNTKPGDVASYTPGPHGEKVRVGLPTDHLRAESQRRSPQVFATVGAARATWQPPDWCQPRMGAPIEKLVAVFGAERVRQVFGSLDTPAINDGDTANAPVAGVDPDAEGVQQKGADTRVKYRNLTLKELGDILPWNLWLQALGNRAGKAVRHYTMGLKGKQYLVPDAHVSTLLDAQMACDQPSPVGVG